MFQPKTSHSNVFRHFNKTSYIHRPVIIFQAFVVYSQIFFYATNVLFQFPVAENYRSMLIKPISAFGTDNNNILTSRIAAVISDDIIKAPLHGNLPRNGDLSLCLLCRS